MSIIIAIAIFLVVGVLVAKFYPKSNVESPLAQGEILTPDPEVEAPVVEAPKPIPTLTAKPVDQTTKPAPKSKKKYNHNNKKPKTTK